MKTGFLPTAVLSLIVVGVAASCASTGRLDEYDFRGATVAVVHEFPPYPEVFTGPWFPGHPDNPVRAVLEVGGRVAKEVGAAELRPRLDAASELVNVPDRMAERALSRVARYLGARPVDNPESSDFLFEIVVREHGIDAEDWHAAAHFFVDAEVFLIERETGTLVWKRHVRERDALTPHIFGPGTVVRDIVTAEAFASLSVEEIAAALERLADYSADRVSDELRESLDEVRTSGGLAAATPNDWRSAKSVVE